MYKNKESLAEQKLKVRRWLIIIFIGIFLSGIFYLKQINCLATKGYKIRDLENKASELREKNKRLELQITELRSTERITKEVGTLKMIEVVRLEYLRPDGSAVALNR